MNSAVRASKVLSRTDTGLARTHQSGILIPKDERILRLLPRLDPSSTNPDRQIEVWVPQLDTFWSARFVFYNTKDLGTGTRSEYRLTQIASLLRQLGAMPGDVISLSRGTLGDLELRVEARPATDVVAVSAVLKSGWIIEIN